MRYLDRIGAPADELARAELIWFHVLAVGYSPRYLAENADGVRQDWPRIPLPKTLTLLEESARLGRQVAELLDTSTSFKGIAGVAEPASRTGAPLRPSSFSLTAGWGRRGKDGAVMPGKGGLQQRPYSAEERASLKGAAGKFGPTTFDIFLNQHAYWRNVPEAVWEFTIGGYQVLKKWLSYRESTVLGRPLTKEEVREWRGAAQRIAGLVLLQPALDANYTAAAASASSAGKATGATHRK
jgi:hypothetical protein